MSDEWDDIMQKIQIFIALVIHGNMINRNRKIHMKTTNSLGHFTNNKFCSSRATQVPMKALESG